jgi:hypothetical protein
MVKARREKYPGPNLISRWQRPCSADELFDSMPAGAIQNEYFFLQLFKLLGREGYLFLVNHNPCIFYYAIVPKLPEHQALPLDDDGSVRRQLLTIPKTRGPNSPYAYRPQSRHAAVAKQRVKSRRFEALSHLRRPDGWWKRANPEVDESRKKLNCRARRKSKSKNELGLKRKHK